jgi:hypothetical protein
LPGAARGDPRFRKPLTGTYSKENQQLTSAKCEQVRQNPQPPRNQNSPETDSGVEEPKGGDE